MKQLTSAAAMLAMIILLTGCGGAAETGKTQGTTAEQSQPQTAEQSQLQTAEQSQLQTAEQSLPQTAVLLTEKDYSEQEKKSLEILEGKLAKDSDRLVYSGNFIVNIYDDFSWKTEADIFPAKLDLRARGTVTPVKSQSPWASCWSFGAIASSETSILKKLELDQEEICEILLELCGRHWGKKQRRAACVPCRAETLTTRILCRSRTVRRFF